MRLSAGLDLIELSRIGRSLKNPRFLLRCFSLAERELFAARGNSVQTIAAGFAAKEAFSKVLGTGIRGFSLQEVSLLRDDQGAPYLMLEGRAKALAQERGLTHFSVSVTHTKEYAAAVVVACQGE